MISVYILGDKNLFKSKTAITRLKQDIKNKKNIESSNYLIDQYYFDIKKIEENGNLRYNINILDKNKKQNRVELKNKIKMLRAKRDGSVMNKVRAMKRTVPKNIFEKYMNLIKKYNFDIPSPDKIFDDPDTFKKQISYMSSDFARVSNDQNANNSLKSYFKAVAELLNIEPMSIKIPDNTNLQPQNILKQEQNNSDTEDEDDVPELLSTTN